MLRIYLKRIFKKLIYLIIVIFFVTATTFLMVDLLPGDAAYDIAGEEATPEDIVALQEELGLNKPLVVRYFNWVVEAGRGNLGVSLRTQEPVIEAVTSRLPVTIELMLISQILALLLAVPLALLSAVRPGSRVDNLLTAMAFGSMSIPIFVMSLLLIFFFAIKLRWLPATGYLPITEGLWPNLQSFLLPAFSIAMVEWVPLIRVLRSDLITTLQQDYILLARSKGLSKGRILFRHALRPSSFSLITIIGLQAGHLIGGALIVEIIFALPGIGRLLVGAIFGQDHTLIQGVILFITVAYVGINVLVDLIYTILDPRVRKDKAIG